MFVASIWLSSSWRSSHSARQIPSRQAKEATETCFLRMKLVLVVIYKREIADSLLECCGSEKFFFCTYLFCFFPQLKAFWVGSVQHLWNKSSKVLNILATASGQMSQTLRWLSTTAFVLTGFENSKYCASQSKHNWVYVNGNKNKLLISPNKLLILSACSRSHAQGILRNFPFESSRRSRCW